MTQRDFEPLPYYRWYWRDYRSSRRVQRMHFIARGLYRELMDECWAKGAISTDFADLAEICGCPVKIMEKHWPELAPMFTPAGPGMVTSERIEQERTDSDRTRAANSRAGIKSGQSRRQNDRNGKEMNGNERPLNERERPRTRVQRSRTSSSSSSSKQSISSSSTAGSPPGPKNGPRSPAPIGPTLLALCVENGVTPPAKVIA